MSDAVADGDDRTGSDPVVQVDPNGSDGSAAPERNLIDRTADRVDRLQRRVPPAAVVFAVTKKYGEDKGGQLSGLLAYRGFFSLFPLLLAFVNALGIVLADNDELRKDLVDSVLSNVPVIGQEISTDPTALGGNWFVLIGSILFSLWAGLGLLEILQESLNTVWEVPQYRRPPFIIRKLRCLPGAIIILMCALLSGASRWWLADTSLRIVHSVVAILLPIVAGALAYLGLHWLMCARKVPFVSQLPGAALCGIGWWALQSLGGWYVTRIVNQASATYGVFVVVLGLLSWAALLGMLYLYSIELSSVLYTRRWPRSLTGRDLTDADVAAIEAVTVREVRVEGAEIQVEVPEGTPT